MAITANKLLIKFGQSVTLTRLASAAYDPATSSATITETTQTGRGAIFDYGNHAINGTQILTGDKQLYLSAIGIVPPLVGDKVTVNSSVYTLVDIKQLSPAGELVLCECQLRGV